ncbi:MAG TPA: hypothetical protein VFB34_01840 [Chloroflexota bacterium]|nr:hypothetical protein [Chloroflexota bacterium]
MADAGAPKQDDVFIFRMTLDLGRTPHVGQTDSDVEPRDASGGFTIYGTLKVIYYIRGNRVEYEFPIGVNPQVADLWNTVAAVSRTSMAKAAETALEYAAVHSPPPAPEPN